MIHNFQICGRSADYRAQLRVQETTVIQIFGLIKKR